ncbi:unnamed protein product [Rangifer tarandus platyrhynchus]|uniref:Uncharacterized protein n=2 Tax=Rangifer tarandus platyrhynchus TaxID=3082113 RepID=A0ABN8ZEU8_RANTA|nr:unnamed protein product [Rangifer tarandus platyrhynchus]CAI9707533.1 unnamed protein product [Rangifer tarandus platyrhynchus]
MTKVSLSGARVDLTPGRPGSDRGGPRFRELSVQGPPQPRPGAAPPHLPLFPKAPPTAASSLPIGRGAVPEHRGAARGGASCCGRGECACAEPEPGRSLSAAAAPEEPERYPELGPAEAAVRRPRPGAPLLRRRQLLCRLLGSSWIGQGGLRLGAIAAPAAA